MLRDTNVTKYPSDQTNNRPALGAVIIAEEAIEGDNK